MAPPARSPWHGTTTVNIGKALLGDGGAGLTASELEAAIGGPHQSNLKKLANQLVEADVLKAVDPPRHNGHPGRPAQVAFTFADGERERFEDLLEDHDHGSGIDVGTSIVFVDAEHKRSDLLKILSLPGVMSGSGKTYELEGDCPQIMVSFEGPTAVDDSRDFLEILAAAELKARRQFVTKASNSGELRKAARRGRQRVERTREQLRAMRTSPRPE